MKKLAITFMLFLFGCSSDIQKNHNSTSSPSTRIDNIQSGANKILKEIDE